MTRAEAVGLCADKFPDGLEFLVDELGVTLSYDEIQPCLGWCIKGSDGKYLIRIADDIPKTRQRSTLAHELGHVLDSTTPELFGGAQDSRHSLGSKQEREAFRIGGDLVLPPQIIRDQLGRAPIDPLDIAKLARKAGISEFLCALQVSRHCKDLGAKSAAVVWFEDGKPPWFPNKSFKDVTRIAEQVVEKAQDNHLMIARLETDRLVYVGHLLCHHQPRAKSVFIQKLAKRNAGYVAAERMSSYEAELSGSSEERGKLEKLIESASSEFSRQAERIDAAAAAVRFLRGLKGNLPDELISELASPNGHRYLEYRFSRRLD